MGTRKGVREGPGAEEEAGEWEELEARLSPEISPLILRAIALGISLWLPEERTPPPLGVVLGSVREKERNTIPVPIGNQMPDAAKARRLNWGLEAELYRHSALVASLKAGKFFMQVQ